MFLFNAENSKSLKILMDQLIKQRIAKLIFAVVTITNPISSYASSLTVGFKELILGMSERSISTDRKITCKNGDSIYVDVLDKKPGELAKERNRIRSLSKYGDRYCSSPVKDTINGIPVSDMKLLFFSDSLGEINFTINESGIRTSTGDGFGVWTSDNLNALVRSLNHRFGGHIVETELVCHQGRCRDAPKRKTYIWRPISAEIKLTYVERTFETGTRISFRSTKFIEQTKSLEEQDIHLSEEIRRSTKVK